MVGRYNGGSGCGISTQATYHAGFTTGIKRVDHALDASCWPVI